MKEIVIEIRDELYETIIDPDKWLTPKRVNNLVSAVLHGKVLPKGHGKIIEVTPKLEAILATYQRYTGIDEMPFEYASEAIAKAPTLVEADKGDTE